ncbi:GSCFA family protein [Tepidamorphus gemmatus]|jgi:hypothetical protein|uniref:GSCFA family protein n=1 Tax=Tepidamorphus gemmatus TaxID=747076 RepID=A0A4R3MJG1_9HYPH|nr:GSCFA domain-containing protein [Tepidamorphus gemmatus]TCT11885.1 GSCFA family protein [Tepidamorphus gemmatus]
MATPYSDQPPHAFWRSAMAGVPADDVDPVVRAAFRIPADAPVMTAGSCFAQHIGRNLEARGLNHLVTETAHPLMPPDMARAAGYGVFSARYANIYTARQFLQLLQRAYGRFEPVEDVWSTETGRFVDPFRPRIEPQGFRSAAACRADTVRHLGCVRAAVEQMSVLVFTLGLTEAWRSRADGATYPLCPGVAGGSFDPARYEFVNFGVDEVADDLTTAIGLIRDVNPSAKVILTVSPVPLAATAVDRHVLVSTTLSKAVLRVAAEQVASRLSDVAYFPSYEIITGPHARGSYFGADLRSVTEAGVEHVMRLFFRHYMGLEPRTEVARSPVPADARSDAHTEEMAELVEVDCDEVVLEALAPENGDSEPAR